MLIVAGFASRGRGKTVGHQTEEQSEEEKQDPSLPQELMHSPESSQNSPESQSSSDVQLVPQSSGHEVEEGPVTVEVAGQIGQGCKTDVEFIVPVTLHGCAFAKPTNRAVHITTTIRTFIAPSQLDGRRAHS